VLAVDDGRERILSVWQWQWGHLLGKVAVSIESGELLIGFPEINNERYRSKYLPVSADVAARGDDRRRFSSSR